MTEALVTKAVKDFLEAQGWRAVRMQRTVSGKGFQTGEPGMPDFLFLHYGRRWQTLWIEFKALGRKANCRCATKAPRQRCTACDQRDWAIREKARGGVVWTIDDFETFHQRYIAAYGPHGALSQFTC